MKRLTDGRGDDLFAGPILETTILYESRHENVAHDIRAIDPTWLLNRQRVLGSRCCDCGTQIVDDPIAEIGASP